MSLNYGWICAQWWYWPKDTPCKKFRFNQNGFWISMVARWYFLNFNYLFTLIINLSQSLFFFTKHFDSKALFHGGNKTRTLLGIYSFSLVSFVLYGVFLLTHYWVSISSIEMKKNKRIWKTFNNRRNINRFLEKDYYCNSPIFTRFNFNCFYVCLIVLVCD